MPTETDIPREQYEQIEQLIANTESPVGIDAKKTHILILDKLARIEQRLDALEKAGERSDR